MATAQTLRSGVTLQRFQVAKQTGSHERLYQRQSTTFLTKDIGKFRGTSDVRVKVKEGQKFFDIRLPPEEFVYGVSNRPSTPIKNVICNNYAK